MKNIFVLPSDKPSRIGYIRELESYHFFNDKENNNELFDNLVVNRNIYITNSEEIKEGDYYFYICGINGLVDKAFNKNHNPITCKKIILTTDPELIKNGVQEVPEYFLKWFIVGKNPIEYVEIKPHLESLDTMKNSYEIIIPQPKQETIEE